MTEELHRALSVCKDITRAHGTSYYIATQFLSERSRNAVYALYGFVRTADDIVDLPGEGSPAERLSEFTDAFHRAVKEGKSSNPVLHAAQWVMREYAIPPEEPDAFLKAMHADLTQTRYLTYQELEGYMYGSASVVGIMLSRIFGVRDDSAYAYAVDLGNAMQLTNFIRDIREDYDLRGRIYLPLEDLERFGITEAVFVARTATPAFKELLRFEIARARELYSRADNGIPLLSSEAQTGVRLARVLYSRILDRVEALDYDVFKTRARVSGPMKMWSATPVLVRGMLRR